MFKSLGFSNMISLYWEIMETEFEGALPVAPKARPYEVPRDEERAETPLMGGLFRVVNDSYQPQSYFLYVRRPFGVDYVTKRSPRESDGPQGPTFSAVVRDLLGDVLTREMVELVPETGTFVGSAQDVCKVGGYISPAYGTLKEALRANREREDALFVREHGNVITSSSVRVFTTEGSGVLTSPAFGKTRFYPDRVAPAGQILEGLALRQTVQVAEIERMVQSILNYTAWDGRWDREFRYGGDVAAMSAAPTAPADPRYAHINSSLHGRYSWEDAYDSGLLEAWSRHVDAITAVR